MSLLAKLKQNSKIKDTAILSESEFFNYEQTPTDVPMMNVALSGDLGGGLGPGLGILAGPSKHFKSAFSLLIASAYLKAHDDAVLLFYDTEFGSPQSYFKTFEIDLERVIHTPVQDIESLKFDIISQLENIDKKDNVIIIVDSIGNIASKKELEDAKNEKSVADMSRAKALKGLFRMVTPYLTMKHIPMVCINHTYKEIAMYPKDIMSGGCLVKGTRLQTSTGLKNIEDFVEGDTVITLDGEKEVTHTWDPDTLHVGAPECYEIEFEDGYTVTVSDGHLFLTDGGWVRADALEVNESVKISGVINTTANEK